MNVDGCIDLVVTNPSSSPIVPVGNGSTVSVLLGKCDETFRDHRDFSTGVGAAFLAAGHFSCGRKPDLAVTNFNQRSVSIPLGNFSGEDRPKGTTILDSRSATGHAARGQTNVGPTVNHSRRMLSRRRPELVLSRVQKAAAKISPCLGSGLRWGRQPHWHRHRQCKSEARPMRAYHQPNSSCDEMIAILDDLDLILDLDLLW
jgi:hypothetical protein